MRRFAIFLLLFSLSTSAAFAQNSDLDRLMTRRYVSCNDATVNCLHLIPAYYAAGKIDSVRILLNYWQTKCGQHEPMIRTAALLDIKDGSFHEQNYGYRFLDALLEYRNAFGQRGAYYADTSFYRYDRFTKQLAEEISSLQQDSMQHLIAIFYQNDFYPLLQALKENRFPGRSLQEQYNLRNSQIANSGEFHMSFLTEFWMPLGGAKILGNHPGVGFQIGIKKKRTLVDLTMLFRFIKAKNFYQVFSQDSMFTTNHFFGGYIGADVSQVIFQTTRSELMVLGGVAFDGFDAIKYDEKAGIDAVSINSLNLNGGIGYRYFYNPNGAYLGIQARYNVVDYSSKGGTDLSGHTISLRLLWGFSIGFNRPRNAWP